MTPNDRGSVTFVDMVLVLLEDQYPWLATDSRDAVSGADTVDQLVIRIPEMNANFSRCDSSTPH